MGQVLVYVGFLMDMPGWRIERRVGTQAHRDTLFLTSSLFDHGSDIVGHRLPRHYPGNAHHRVNHKIEVGHDFGVAVDLKVARRPLLVQHAKRDFGIASHGLCLGPVGHGRDQDLRRRGAKPHDGQAYQQRRHTEAACQCRGTDDEAAILRRLEVAAEELQALQRYNFEIVNRTVEQSVDEICQKLMQYSHGAKHA